MDKELELKEMKVVLRFIVENKTDKDNYTTRGLEMIKKALNYIENSIPKKVIERKLDERLKSVEKCYQDLIKNYYDEKLNIINTSFMTKEEKEEFINKRNCLLVQKHCYEEFLKLLESK